MDVISRIDNFWRKHIKWLLSAHQRLYTYQSVNVKYLLIPRKSSKVLVVVFSGMSPKGAVYNYIDVLNGCPHNRLYILDDFGHDRLGCYYIGTNGQNQMECAVNALLKQIIHEHDIVQTVFCGSSRGGYAALNFGLEQSNSIIIAGAPQYYLGYYLSHRKSPELMNIVLGTDCTPLEIQELDAKIYKKIVGFRNKYQGKIYLHFSDQEHTYHEHIQYLLSDLDSCHYDYAEDRMSYLQHDDVAIYFPQYLKKIITEI